VELQKQFIKNDIFLQSKKKVLSFRLSPPTLFYFVRKSLTEKGSTTFLFLIEIFRVKREKSYFKPKLKIF